MIESKPSQDAKANKSEEENVRAIGEKMVEPTSKPRCTHHFGYLSERSSKEQIPEECMVCASMLDCILKSVKS